MSESQLRRRAAGESRGARCLRSLLRAAEHLGIEGELGIDAYKRARRQLRDAGEELETPNRIISHFGSWRAAKEAVQLSGDASIRQIEARFAKRRLDKVWRYTEATLREVLNDCARELGHVPQLAEFEHWRERQLEIARARGDDALHLPSGGPYRRRWGSWEKALLALGYTPDEVAERLEQLS